MRDLFLKQLIYHLISMLILKEIKPSFLGLSKNKINYMYCYELYCSLSQKAAKKFASLGYPVKKIKGGLKAWKEHAYPIEK